MMNNWKTLKITCLFYSSRFLI